MQLRDISFGSLRRRRLRGGFVVAALALGIGTLVALVSLTRAIQTDIGDELDRFGANIVVTPRSTMVDLAYGGVDLGGVSVDGQRLTLDDTARIRTIHNSRNISAVAPKLIGTTRIGDQKVVLAGAVLRQERGVKGWWQFDGEWPVRADEVIIGSEAAARLGAKPGTTLRVGDRQFHVTAVVQPTGAMDDHAVFADLSTVQTLLGRPDELSVIEVSALCRGCPIEDIVAQIGAALPHARVLPIRQAVAVREQAVAQMTNFAWLVAVVVLAAAVLVVMTTMLASVTERTQEIGILRAVGFRQSHVVRIILVEVAIVSAVGGLTGWVVGLGGAAAFARYGAQLATPIRPDLTLAAASLGVAVLLGVVAGLYPALRAARLDPAQAFRQV